MKPTIVVENHQPVPLRPLKELFFDGTQVLWVGLPVYHGHPTSPTDQPVGWVARSCDDDLVEYVSLKDTGMFQLTEILDLEKTMGRALQPGEKLVVTFAS